jgi:DNA-binding CsgD family transcriptional regulator
VTLTVSDYVRVLGLLEDCGTARAREAFDHRILAGLAQWAGWEATTLMLATPPAALEPTTLRPVRMHGIDEAAAQLWWERWRWIDVWASKPAARALARDGAATLSDLPEFGGRVECAEYIEGFLAPLGLGSQLVMWIDTGLPMHAYLSVHRERSSSFTSHDRELVAVLRRQLATLFRLRMLIDGTGDCPALVGHEWAVLSVRERAVAALVAQGESNRVVARRLGIREDTVKKHLSQVFAKLEVRSRTELAAQWGHRCEPAVAPSRLTLASTFVECPGRTAPF